MREQSIHYQGIDCDDNARKDGSKHKRKIDSNSLLFGIRVLDGIVAQREMLVIWLDSVKGVEAKNENSISDQVSHPGAGPVDSS